MIDIRDFIQKSWITNIKFSFTKQFFKFSWVILLILVVLLIIDKKIVEIKINSGYNKIYSIKSSSWNIDFLNKQIDWAKSDFLIWDILFTPFLIFPIDDVKNWYYALKWWSDISKILDKSLKIYTWTNQFITKSGWIENIKITNLLSNIKWEYSEIMTLLYSSIIYYDKIWKLPNKDLNDKLLFAKTKLKETYKILDIINKDYDIFLRLLWHNVERKYLIIFQNNDEIRPTWWFMWSLATVTVRNWKVISFVKEDVYSYEWDINKVMTLKEQAPEWLNKITETFWFRDSNYFIGFEASSNSIKSFIDKVDRHVDGIVYMNQNTILDFLKYTWGIKFDQLNETITEDNFSLIISTLVEAKVFKVWALWTPKQVLFDFANVFTNVLKEKKDYYAYLNIIIKNIKSRDLVIYSFNPEENNLLWKLWLNWKINYQDTLDFAYPVYTSVWWNKSDRYIDLKYKKSIIKNTDCSIDTNLSINRSHMFSIKEEEKVNQLLDNHKITEKTDYINIQWKWENRSYVRVILPKDAIIEKKDWMNIIKNDTFQQVDYYQNTRLLETSTFDIKYRLPNPKCSNYTYKLYKQPGIREYDVEIKDKTNIVKKDFIWGDYVYGGKSE